MFTYAFERPVVKEDNWTASGRRVWVVLVKGGVKLPVSMYADSGLHDLD